MQRLRLKLNYHDAFLWGKLRLELCFPLYEDKFLWTIEYVFIWSVLISLCALRAMSWKALWINHLMRAARDYLESMNMNNWICVHLICTNKSLRASRVVLKSHSGLTIWCAFISNYWIWIKPCLNTRACS